MPVHTLRIQTPRIHTPRIHPPRIHTVERWRELQMMLQMMSQMESQRTTESEPRGRGREGGGGGVLLGGLESVEGRVDGFKLCEEVVEALRGKLECHV